MANMGRDNPGYRWHTGGPDRIGSIADALCGIGGNMRKNILIWSGIVLAAAMPMAIIWCSVPSVSLIEAFGMGAVLIMVAVLYGMDRTPPGEPPDY